MKKILTSAFIFISVNCFAQHEFDNWYFGGGAGISFTTGSPVNVAGGMLNTTEGCSSQSDAAGTLLFYTDGITVWNRNHVAMPNGFGLLGNGSTSQSAVIVPNPADPNQYYIFAVGVTGGGLSYSIVDITLAGGLGDVTGVKNVPLLGSIDEKITATCQTNGTGYWIIVHEISSSFIAYYVYPVTAAGVGAPVVSNSGILNTGGNAWTGYMKVSPDGTHLANAMYGMTGTEISDFDRSTGVVSNSFFFTATAGDFMYGVEFSETGDVLYTGTVDYTPSHLYQLNMRAGSQAAILASATLIATSNDVTGGLQTAPDHKIYWADYATSFLSVINDPEVLGAGCNYVDHGYACSNTVYLGLPNFVSGVCAAAPPVINFIASDRYICPNTCIDFTNFTVGATSYQWYFPGGMPDTSTAVNPTFICYDTPGNYPVTLVATNAVGSDSVTLNNMIHVYPQPGTPVITQVGNMLIATPGFATYQWYFGSDTIAGANSDSYYATQNGNYNLAVTDSNGCVVGVGILNVVIEIDGLNQLIINNGQFTISPNPAKDKITVTLVIGQSSMVSFEIYNSIGERVYSSSEKNISGKFSKEILLGDFAKGVYNFQVKSSSSFAVKKFIIDK